MCDSVPLRDYHGKSQPFARERHPPHAHLASGHVQDIQGMTKRVSIKDIAMAAGVSHSTVSRALHGTGRMSEETRSRILELAEEMGYAPDALARSLVLGRTFTIGVVVTTIADPFVTEIVSGIEMAAQDAGYSVFLSSSHSDPERELAVVETFRQRRVDAIIVTASRLGSMYSTDLDDVRVPIVLINNQGEGEYLHSVSVDEVAGADMAVSHLLELGHRRIGFIGSARRPFSSERRLQGYRQAHRRYGVHPASRFVVAPKAASDVEVGRVGFQKLWSLKPTAIFTYNDMTAIGVMMAAKAAGVMIPQDMSLIGFDDVHLTQYVTPALSTIRQPRQEMGAAAMNMVLDLLEGIDDAEDLMFPCELVERESTAPPP